LALAAKFSRRR